MKDTAITVSKDRKLYLNQEKQKIVCVSGNTYTESILPFPSPTTCHLPSSSSAPPDGWWREENVGVGSEEGNPRIQKAYQLFHY
mmetsp:Transcript_26199/g.52220  ORF Transcript_26199/g.52220 Transcript_26199/m.52220 type:complete len:84 (+) Transcript_26199:115-366(+)